jgi:hypothetical protein
MKINTKKEEFFISILAHSVENNDSQGKNRVLVITQSTLG